MPLRRSSNPRVMRRSRGAPTPPRPLRSSARRGCRSETPDEGRRLRRAALASLDSGRRTSALSLAERARPLVADAVGRAELEFVRAAVEFHRGSPDEAHRTLMDGAVAVGAAAPRFATAMILAAIEVSAFGGWPERAFVERARGRPRVSSRPQARKRSSFACCSAGSVHSRTATRSLAAERLTEAATQWRAIRAAAAAPSRRRRLRLPRRPAARAEALPGGACRRSVERVVPRASDQSLLLRAHGRGSAQGRRGRGERDRGHRDRARAGAGESRDRCSSRCSRA